MSQAPMIQAVDLTRKFGAQTALDAVDLSVDGPGVLALLGPNGAGKTTFVNAALGLVRPSGGLLTVFGALPGSKTARTRIGVMMQDAELPDLLTAREQIGLFASYYPAPRAVDEVIALCELTAFADKRYAKLSGGQKRRVQFALALVGAPELLFLDEPTTGLDAEARRGLWTIVRSAAENGARVVLTTHYLEEADALADRVAVLKAGRIIADDTAANLREQVGGSLIRCATVLSEPQLNALPAVRRARRTGRYGELVTADAVATLKALFAADPQLEDLNVRQPTLEEAFDALTRTTEAHP
jgi:ABC-2 type transport system ATP-binding protein